MVKAMGMASRRSKPAIKASSDEIVSIFSSPVEPITFFTSSDPLAQRDQNAERDKHPQGQDDDECNRVHGLLLSFSLSV